jgi:prepilin-type N-terminal cleavage/methylation domain-containing protein
MTRVIHITSRKALAGVRNQQGVHLVEMLIAITISAVLMMSAYSSGTAMYRASASGENQVLASSMAQQVIDNARNSTYRHLRDDVLGAGVVTKTENISLYDYPVNPQFAMYPRPLLRNLATNSGMVFSDEAMAKAFNGTVSETLTNLTPAETENGMIRVNVDVRWSDSRGQHSYSTGTTISQTGIHN